MSNIIYNISNEYLQVAHKIAQVLVKEQKRIEPTAGKKGIIAELSKLITYLDTRIQQNINLKKEEKKPLPLNFFEYLETLAEHSTTIGYSKQTPEYYQSIYEACDTYLKHYLKKPIVMLQILGWSQRLMHYYLLDASNLDDIIGSLQIEEDEEPIVSHPKLPKSDNDIKSTATKIQSSSTLKSPHKRPQHPKSPTQPANSQQPKSPIPPKPQKTAEKPKLEKPKAPEPPSPFNRPPKPPKK